MMLMVRGTGAAVARPWVSPEAVKTQWRGRRDRVRGKEGVARVLRMKGREEEMTIYIYFRENCNLLPYCLC